MKQLILVRDGMALKPVNAAEAERLDSIPSGAPMLWSGMLMRSPQHHRFFFALLNLLWDSMSDIKQSSFDGSLARFRKWLTCRAGHGTSITVPFEMLTQELIDAFKAVDPDIFFAFEELDIRIMRAKSIAWDTMDQSEFRPFCDRVIAMVPEILGSAPEDVVRMVEDMVGFTYTSLGEEHGRIGKTARGKTG